MEERVSNEIWSGCRGIDEMERCVGCVVVGSGALLVDLEVLDENGE